MKRLGCSLFLGTLALMLGGTALAQNVGDNSVYFVTYYSNANTAGAPDATVRIINDGEKGAGTNGTLWADFYVFDDSEELQDCCSCAVTPDGLLSESVNQQLVNFDLVLTPKLNRAGVIKVISSSSNDPTAPVPTPGLREFATHIQATRSLPSVTGPFSTSETEAIDANLSTAERSLLGELCYYAMQLGSGFGVCTCTYEDYDF
jgi:hypothetical protein